MAQDSSPPRLTVEITLKQRERLGRLIPWGAQKAVFSAVIDDLCDALEKAGPNFLGMLIARSLPPGAYIKKSGDDE